MRAYWLWMVGLGVLACGCAGDDEPQEERTDAPVEERPLCISRIYGDGYEERFVRGEDGCVIGWANSDMSCRFDYTDENLIRVHSERRDFTDTRYLHHYEESLLLNKGLVDFCEGVWSVEEDGVVTPFKKYMVDFGYDDTGHLQTILGTQFDRNRTSDGWDETRPWRWENKVYWDGDNITRFENAAGAKDPSTVYTYTYLPIERQGAFMAFAMIMHHWCPLQYDGWFGKLPVNLVASVVISEMRGIPATSETTYEYVFEDGLVQSYSMAPGNGRNIERCLLWNR